MALYPNTLEVIFGTILTSDANEYKLLLYIYLFNPLGYDLSVYRDNLEGVVHSGDLFSIS